ncbi:MAG TPA: hypothetical protein DD979_06975 [Gammaproteobacteria bacterium]|jgi:hypothetical protein|nr:hypothetical protein [Gammaproteobacteria bacterium]
MRHPQQPAIVSNDATHPQAQVLSDWSACRHALQCQCTSLENLSHALQNAQTLIVGLQGRDALPHAAEPVVTQAGRNGDQPQLPLDYQLHSDCSSVMLKRHCDKLLMDTALSQASSDKQLFLATDFLCWQDPNTGREHLYPIILYPAELFDRERTSAQEETSFALLVDGKHARVNPELVAKLPAPIARISKEFDPLRQQPYLLSLAVGLQTQPQYTLTKRVVINAQGCGTQCDSRRHEDPIPGYRWRNAVPEHLNVQLALSILDRRGANDVHQRLRALDTFTDALTVDSLPASVHALKNRALALATLGLDHLPLEQLHPLPMQLKGWADNLQRWTESDALLAWAKTTPLNVKLLNKLSECLRMLEQTPPGCADVFHPDHAYRSSLPALQRAKFQYRLICAERQSLADIFDFDQLPELERIQLLYNTLNDSQSSDVVSTNYFHARKALSQLFIDGTVNYTETQAQQLERLIKILRLQNLFVNNHEYALSFGPLFKGMATDWRLLETSVTFSRQIGETLGNDALAAELLVCWHHAGSQLRALQETAHKAADALHDIARLLRISNSAEMAIPDFLAQATSISERLDLLNRDQLADMPAFSSLSAHEILASLELIDTAAGQPTTQAAPDAVQAIRETVVWLQETFQHDTIGVQELATYLHQASDQSQAN